LRFLFVVVVAVGCCSSFVLLLFFFILFLLGILVWVGLLLCVCVCDSLSVSSMMHYVFFVLFFHCLSMS